MCEVMHLVSQCFSNGCFYRLVVVLEVAARTRVRAHAHRRVVRAAVAVHATVVNAAAAAAATGAGAVVGTVRLLA